MLCGVKWVLAAALLATVQKPARRGDLPGGDVMGRFAEWRDLREEMERKRKSWLNSRQFGSPEVLQRQEWEEYRRVVRLAPSWLRGRHAAAVKTFPGTEGPV